MFKVNFQKRFLQFAVAVTLCLAGAAQSKPKNVIFFIGDGMGPQQVKAGGIYVYGASGALSFESFPYQGQLTTYSANSSVTDSAAAGTALATGYKVNNGVISMAYPANPDYSEGSELPTLLEYFKARGKSTGLVSTAYLTDATPAGFGAHEPTRSNYSQIAGDYLNQTQPNVLFGGGANGMSRSSAEAAGYTVVENKAAMLALDTENVSKVSGQFGSTDLPYEYDGLGSLPHLSEMTATALNILDNDPDGFFLMVEGGRIDDACHSNDFTRTIPEVNEFADAVQAAINWAAGRNDTLIIVAADHETGGLTVLSNNGAGNYPDVSWSGTGHTAANVTVYAWGVNAGFISGVMDNTDIFGVVTADTVTLDSPSDGSVIRSTQVSLTCSATSDHPLIDATLYLGQASGTSNTVTFSGPADTDDAQIYADNPTTNYGTATSVKVDGLSPHAHSVIKFPNIFGSGAGQVPSGAIITSATLKVNCTNLGNIMKLYRLTEDWVESQVTWNNRSSGTPWTGAGAQGGSNAGVAINGDCTALGWRTIDVTQFAQEWSSGAPNYGIVLIDSGSDGIDFDSSESANPPLLTITYQSMQARETKLLSGTSDSVTFSTLTLNDQTDYVWNCLVRSTNGQETYETWAPLDSHLRVDSQIPNEPALVAPADGASNVSISPTLDVTVSDPQGGLVDVTFYGRTVPSPDDYFTIVVLPDTQYYTQSNTVAIFNAQTQWIVNNVTAQNIVFVTHEGDLVQNWNATAEWNNANNSMSLLDGVVPYGVLPGNHDKNNGDIYLNDRTYFNQNFPYTRYAGLNWYGGHFPSTGNENNFQLFSAGGDDYVFIHLEDYPDDGTPGAVIAWAGSVLASYPNRKAIITTHGYLNTTGGYTGKWGSTQYIRNNLVAAYDNVYFVFSGHHTGEYIKTTSVNGRQVHELLADYHADGWLRIMRFVPAENKVYVKTYSPWLGQYQTDNNSRFTLDFPMNEFEVIGTDTGVQSGQNVSIVWSGLSIGSQYEWFAEVTDSTAKTRVGPVWSFTVGLNQSPAAVNDAYSTNEDTALTVNAPGVLTNDTDADSDPLTAVLVGNVSNGTLTVNSDGSFSYTPNTNFSGTDSFAYMANDGTSNSNVATVTITVNNVDNDPPVAVDDATTTNEDAAVIINVLQNDSDPDPGDTLSVTLVTQGANGSVVINPDNTVSYTPNLNFNGADTFTYTVSDGKGGTDTATVTVTVNSVNDSPVADSQSVTTNEDTPVAITLTGSDPEVDPLTYFVQTPPTNGTLSGTAPNLTYTPNANFNGLDTFTFKVNDGAADSEPATVSITIEPVNDAPVADNQAVTAKQSTAKDITLTASDVEEDPLTYSIVDNPTKGTLTGTSPNLTYTPNAGFTGSDSFTFKATDGTLESSVATVSITVTANNPPVANNQSVTTDEDTPVNITLTASDPDGDELTYSVITGPANGTLNGTGPELTYNPNPNFNGSDSFTFKVNDGTIDSEPATVTITVNPINDAPVANDDSAATDEDTAVVVNVLTNDSDVDNDTLTVESVTQGSIGSVVKNADNTVTYTPNPNLNGTDSFSYIVTDSKGGTDSATVTVTVNATNDPPVANTDSYSVDEDVTLAVPAPGVLGNDSDVENNPLTAVMVSSTTNGSLTLNSDGSFTYTPNANFNGIDTFTYKANDGTADSTVTTVTITVNPINDTPVANTNSYTVDEDKTLTVPAPGVLGNDTDIENSPLTAVLVSGPSNGSLTLNSNGSFTYTPNANFNGSDSFTYKANDGAADSSIATVSIAVNSINDAPVAINDSATTQENTAVTINVLNNDIDADGDTLTVTNLVQPSNGTATLNADQTVTYTPTSGFTGQDSFTYTASDSKISSNMATVTITVNPVGPVTLFSDGFESGNLTAGGWTTSSASVKNSGAYSGTYCAQIKKTGWIRKAISTVGYKQIHIKYARKTQNLDSGENENLYVEWSTNGSQWSPLESTRETTWAYKDLVCGTGADNKSGFMVRFRTNANRTDEYGYVDEVIVTGIRSNP